MPIAPDEIAAWQTRVEEAFRGPSGVIGERLLKVHAAEQRVEASAIAELKGFVTIGDALFDFALHSLDILSQPVRVYHLLRNPLFVACVSRLRASYKLFWMGYYFDAVALLRGIFENVVHLTADANGWVELSAWIDTEGIDLDGTQREITRAMHRRRQRFSQVADGHVFKAQSGLSPEDQSELSNMLDLMHSHVHRTEMHLVHLIADVRATGHPASPLPSWSLHKGSHYANVVLAVGWMLTRLLSFAIPVSQRSESWQFRRNTLDESLGWWFASWDKPLGGAVLRLVEAKFSFEGEWGEPGPKSEH